MNMHPRTRAPAHRTAALLLLAAGACTPPAPPPPPLELEDFALAGVPLDADSMEVRLSFGEPDSVVLAPNPYEADLPLETWYYSGLVVRYEGDPMPSSWVVTGSDESTARGIRVGDPAEAVLERYGEPIYRYDDIWTYVDPAPHMEEHVLEFLIREGRVFRIHVARTR
jgi:hypothetical protein